MTEETPKRIQRKRTKGWKMPENTIYVGRGSKWGNPFTFANSGNIHPAMRFACEVAPLLDASPLRGKNLACWCNLDQECHADTLLDLANKNETLCEGCPPIGYPTDETRCAPCPRAMT